MALTPQQEELLNALLAEKDAAPVWTREGLHGVLHTLIDVVSGQVPHISPEAWAALRADVEQHAEDQAAQAAKVDEAAQIAGAAHQAVVGAPDQAPPAEPAAEPAEPAGDNDTSAGD